MRVMDSADAVLVLHCNGLIIHLQHECLIPLMRHAACWSVQHYSLCDAAYSPPNHLLGVANEFPLQNVYQLTVLMLTYP